MQNTTIYPAHLLGPRNKSIDYVGNHFINGNWVLICCKNI